MVAFPNGTFTNVALVEVNTVNQAWMIQSLYDTLSDQSYGYIGIDGRGLSADQVIAKSLVFLIMLPRLHRVY